MVDERFTELVINRTARPTDFFMVARSNKPTSPRRLFFNAHTTITTA